MEKEKSLIDYLVLFQGLIGVILGFVLSKIKSPDKIKITTINCDIGLKYKESDSNKEGFIIKNTDKYIDSNMLTYDMKIGFYNRSERLRNLHNIKIRFIGKSDTYESTPDNLKKVDNSTIIVLEPYKFIIRDMHAKISEGEYKKFIKIGNIRKVYLIARDANNKEIKSKIKIDNSKCKFE